MSKNEKEKTILTTAQESQLLSSNHNFCFSYKRKLSKFRKLICPSKFFTGGTINAELVNVKQKAKGNRYTQTNKARNEMYSVCLPEEKYGTIIGTRTIYKKNSCYLRDSDCKWRIVETKYNNYNNIII